MSSQNDSGATEEEARALEDLDKKGGDGAPSSSPTPEDIMTAAGGDLSPDVMLKWRWMNRHPGPCQLLDYLYIGNYSDAASVERLQKCGITHVVNCAPCRKGTLSPYQPDTGIIKYLQFPAQDTIDYDILQHYDEVKAFIKEAVKDGDNKQNVLIHCAMGINRSGALCAAYIMENENMDLISTMKLLKEKRGTIVLNRGFQKQLLEFAKARNLYIPPEPKVEDADKPKENGEKDNLPNGETN